MSMIPTLSASWPSHSIARAIFCRFNSETVITCAESWPRTLSVTLMTAKVIRRASPTRPSSPFFGNPIAQDGACSCGRCVPARPCRHRRPPQKMKPQPIKKPAMAAAVARRDFWCCQPNDSITMRQGDRYTAARGDRGKGRVERSVLIIRTLADDFRLHGRQAIEVRKTQPAAYLKIWALLVPKEMKVEKCPPSLGTVGPGANTRLLYSPRPIAPVR